MEAGLSIAEQRLIDALEEAKLEDESDDRPQGALTTFELSERMGWSEGKVRKWLRVLKRKNRIERESLKVIDISDRSIPIPAYRILEGDNDIKEDEP